MNVEIRWRVWSVALVLFLAMFSQGATVAAEFFQPLDPPRPIAVVACYDDASPAPPQTAAALEFAIADGLEWIQLDLRRTRDGQHVLWKSPKMGAVTIHDQSLAELKQHNVGASFAPQFAGQRLLTLREAAALAQGRINLLLVAHDCDPAQLAAEITAAQMLSQALVLCEVVQAAPLAGAEIAIALRVPESALASLEALNAWLRQHPMLAAVALPHDQVSPERVQCLHEAGCLVAIDRTAAPDDPAAVSQLLSAKADLVLTSRPEDLVADYVKQVVPTWPVRMTLHRGASRYAPENTLPALEKAIRLHADLVEFDIHTTADGQFVLLHDRQLDRTTSGRGPVSQSTAEAVAGLDAGSWFAPAFAQTRVPTLDEFLTAIGQRAELYVDAKAIQPHALAERLIAHGLADSGVVYQSPAFIQKLREKLPKSRGLVPLFDPRQVEKLGQTGKFYGVDARWEQLSAELIDRCHRVGVAVFADAHDEHRPADYLQALGWGIDVIQTDHPLRLLRAVELHAQK